jgi:hypothetical protein
MQQDITCFLKKLAAYDKEGALNIQYADALLLLARETMTLNLRIRS